MSTSSVPDGRLAPLTQKDWAIAAKARVFFGHQSVGRNILEGVEEMGSQIPLDARVIVRPLTEDNGGAAILETTVGENGVPHSKLEDFTRLIDEELEGRADFVMLKFCYLDFTPETDPFALFDAYRGAVQTIRERHPHLRFIHVTAPLTGAEARLKSLIKRLLGRVTQADLNLKRARYNDLLRAEFGDEPIFDVAIAESLRADGSQAQVKVDGEMVPVLSPEWTDDGGHLNGAGRAVVASHLISLLSGLGG